MEPKPWLKPVSFIVLFVVLAILGGLYYWNSSTGRIARVLKNATYQVNGQVVKFSNGEYKWPEGQTQISDKYITFGDVNEDGLQDAVVILSTNLGGSGIFSSIAVLENKDGKHEFIDTAELGDRVLINSIKIENGAIILDLVIHGPNDALCCPTQAVVKTYNVVDGKLVSKI